MGYKDVEISIGDVYESTENEEWKPEPSSKQIHIIRDPASASNRAELVVNERGRYPSKLSHERRVELQQKINKGELELVDEDHELNYTPPWIDA